MMQDLFSHFFRSNKWNSPESVSGVGSELRYTRHLRDGLLWFTSPNQIQTLLDSPCGDLNWMQHIAGCFEVYTGVDIVPAIIDRNRERFPRLEFEVGNLLTYQPDQPYDLVLVRDALVHLPLFEARKAWENILTWDFRFLAITNFPETRSNKQIDLGAWRELNMMLPPFDAPKPYHVLHEGHWNKTLAFFKKETLCR
jgi:hypothetical protein